MTPEGKALALYVAGRICRDDIMEFAKAIRETYEDAARIANEHKPPYPREELSQLGRERFDACEAIAASILARTSGETKS
jgi:hypothetical protein